MKEITVANVVNVEKGKGEEVAERFSKPKAVHTFPGFIRMEVWLKNKAKNRMNCIYVLLGSIKHIL